MPWNCCPPVESAGLRRLGRDSWRDVNLWDAVVRPPGGDTRLSVWVRGRCLSRAAVAREEALRLRLQWASDLMRRVGLRPVTISAGALEMAAENYYGLLAVPGRYLRRRVENTIVSRTQRARAWLAWRVEWAAGLPRALMERLGHRLVNFAAGTTAAVRAGGASAKGAAREGSVVVAQGTGTSPDGVGEVGGGRNRDQLPPSGDASSDRVAVADQLSLSAAKAAADAERAAEAQAHEN